MDIKIINIICDMYSNPNIEVDEISKITGMSSHMVRVVAAKHGCKRNSKFDLFKDEIFKIINEEGLENYKISNYGRVVNLDNRLLKASPHHQSDYLQIRLINSDKKRVSKLIHVLVAKTFIDNYDENLTIDHIDRDRQNNHISNLRLLTPAEQSQNMKEREKTVMLTEEYVIDICEKLQNGMSISSIVKTNPLYTKSKVEKIRQRIRWTHISENYVW